MVTSTLLKTIITGYLLMVLCGLLEEWVDIRYVVWDIDFSGLVVAFLCGEILGALLFPLLAEFIGRKFCLMALGIPFVINSVMIAIFNNGVNLVYLARFIGGIFIGGTYTVFPIYIGEISDANSRGQLISTGYTLFMFGDLIVSKIFFGLSEYKNILTIVTMIFTGIFLITFGLVAVESPYYYIKRGHQNAAKQTLDKLRGLGTNTQIELDEIEGKLQVNTQNIHNAERVMPCINGSGSVKSAIMGFGLIISDILIYSGTYFFSEILAFGGVNSNAVSFLSGFFLFISACVCPLVVDRIGRKLLLIISYGGVAVSLTIYTIMINVSDVDPYLILFSTLIVRAFTLIGLAPLQFVLIAELFSIKKRMLASAIFMALLFSFRLLLLVKYNLMPGIVFNLSLIIFSIIMAILVNAFYVETNRRSLQQIQLILNRK